MVAVDICMTNSTTGHDHMNTVQLLKELINTKTPFTARHYSNIQRPDECCLPEQ